MGVPKNHLYKFPQGIYEHKMENVIFLRADRKDDGKRTFKRKTNV